MDRKILFKILPFAGFALGIIGDIISHWANEKEQEAMIEEKISEALAAKEAEEDEES